MKPEYKSLSKKAIKDVDVKAGIVTGFLNRYDIPDNSKDIIRPGSGKKSITERGPDGAGLIKMLWNHDTDSPIASFTKMEEKEAGVFFEAKYGRTQTAKDVLMNIEDGIVTTNSFGFMTVNSHEEGDNRIITEYKIFEGSNVSIADQDYAQIMSVKSLDDVKIADAMIAKLGALKSAIRKSETSDEAIEQLYWEADKAYSYIKELLQPSEDTAKKGQPSEDTDKEEEEKELEEALKSLSLKLETI